MQRNAATRATALLASSLLAIAGLAAAPALAGDRALAEFIGYSADARYFAFEEFGIQDGSGFPYSNLYVVDLENDSWVAGSPFRVRDDNEATTLAEVRSRTRELAGPTLEEFALDQPAHLIALNGDGELSGNGRSLDFGRPGPAPGEIRDKSTLRLATFPAASPQPCDSYTDLDILGFALTLEQGGSEREVFRDRALPRSRGCALDYRLYGVVTMATAGEAPVAIISVYPHGFEGPDRRFLAVPLR